MVIRQKVQHNLESNHLVLCSEKSIEQNNHYTKINLISIPEHLLQNVAQKDFTYNSK